MRKRYDEDEWLTVYFSYLIRMVKDFIGNNFCDLSKVVEKNFALKRKQK
jgi:hypothetical protein